MTDFLSFDPLLTAIDTVANYTNALALGNAKFLSFLPIYFKQTIDKTANQKLNNTREEFKSAVKIDLKDDLIVVTLAPDNFIANAVENGVDSFSMVNSQLKGTGVKISKKGFKYKIIPLRVWTTKPSAKTDLGINYFNKVKETLSKPKFGRQWTEQLASGAINVREEVLAKNDETEGMFRVRQWASTEDFIANKRPKQSQYVLFRTMSERFPEKWVHPGIQPRNILKDSKTIVENNLDQKWEEIVKNILQKKGFG